MPLGAGLHDHHAHVVRDEVVQLARDPCALVGHRGLRDDLALALEQLRAGGERLGAQLAAAYRPAQQDHRGARGHREQDRVLDLGRAEGRDGVGDDQRGQAGDEAARARPDRERVQRAHPADRGRDGRPGRARREDEQAIGEHHGEPDLQRPAAPHGDRGGQEEGVEEGERLRAGDRVPDPQLHLREHYEDRSDDAVEWLSFGQPVHAAQTSPAASAFHLPRGGSRARKIARAGEARIRPRSDDTAHGPA